MTNYAVVGDTDMTSQFYSQNASRLVELYDQAADGILPIVEKFARSKDIHILDYGEAGAGISPAFMPKAIRM